jgi:SAM-dependent methyltransferase
MSAGSCRSCGAPLEHAFADLGTSPLANSFLRAQDLDRAEPFYPLKAYVCAACFLVQLRAYQTPQAIFQEYAYFSSYSESWLEHCRRYAEAAIARFGLGRRSLVIEVASNDGYLLQFFRRSEIPVLGMEPARNVARAAEARGIPTVVEFLGKNTALPLAQRGQQADLLVANNVLAHVPDLNDFIAGLATLLKPGGVLTLEFPHLQQLIAQSQFDTIYHEHFSYFSLLAASAALRRHGLEVFDVEEIGTHGGSLRVYAAHAELARRRRTAEPARVLTAEKAAGLDSLAGYASFDAQVRTAKCRLLEFLIRERQQGRTIAAYGAPAKGNTLLNYCGIRTDFIEYTVDRNPYKQGGYLPGSRIPIHRPEHIGETRPDYVLILPWNLRDEIVEQMRHIRDWGGRFVIPIPQAEVLP